MPTHAEILADQALPFADFPTETITISGTDYQALVSDHRQGLDWQDAGGYMNTLDIQVAIERSTIDASIPTQGTLVTFRAASFRVAEVDSGDKAASVLITLTKPTT